MGYFYFRFPVRLIRVWSNSNRRKIDFFFKVEHPKLSTWTYFGDKQINERNGNERDFAWKKPGPELIFASRVDLKSIWIEEKSEQKTVIKRSNLMDLPELHFGKENHCAFTYFFGRYSVTIGRFHPWSGRLNDVLEVSKQKKPELEECQSAQLTFFKAYILDCELWVIIQKFRLPRWKLLFELFRHGPSVMKLQRPNVNQIAFKNAAAAQRILNGCKIVQICAAWYYLVEQWMVIIIGWPWFAFLLS